MTAEIPRRTLGSTGEEVSIIGMGGAHISRADARSHAIKLVRAGIDRGITFMDNCWDYSQGRSEEWMGDALKGGFRDRVFLMTKIDGRTRAVAAKQIDQSLHRLQVDYVDLMQLHEVIRRDDPRRAFAPGGAMEALVEAREKGKIRFIGFTGHKDPDIHLRMLAQDFAWDTVQLPLNLLDAHYNSFEKKVLPVLNERGIGVLAMKPLAGGELLQTGAVSAVDALRYVMSLPVDVVINGMESLEDVDQALEAAAGFSPLPGAGIEELLQRTAPFAGEGKYEGYKTTHDYDGTYWHPQWMETARV
ncbi:MAG: aldo/keto reductase [Thermoleophilia bacterium]|nr:aldo/keto reductase [Thermoleophilia bacterium]